MQSPQAELVFGFVYAVGTNVNPVVSLLKDYLKQFGYETHEFRVSDHLKALNLGITVKPFATFDEMNALMDAGNEARKRAKANDILAVMAVNEIAGARTDERPLERVAHLVRSLKTPDEVRLLRDVYRPGFFLIGIASDDDEQREYLTNVKGLSDREAEIVIHRDQDEKLPFGQRTRDTFYLADVFIEMTSERYRRQLERFLELVFGHPFKTPTREEDAMFMAYASAARSAQFGRQVGAAITTVEGDVVAVGFNEVPSASGGAYWDEDPNDARDHKYGEKTDSNHLHRARIVDSISANLKNFLLTQENVGSLLDAKAELVQKGMASIPTSVEAEASARRGIHSSQLRDITEYGRAVHAEMDAILTCARLGISVKGKRLFTTTFPCHNCTRHIIASGFSSVTYIEPYPKSRAEDLHKDSICFKAEDAKVGLSIPFVPFVGIGPRRYLDLFSIELSTGAKVLRSDETGRAIFPERAARPPRVPMLPFSYLERETKLLQEYENVINELEGNDHEQDSGQDSSQKQDGLESPKDS
jgi:deoxycytidylate deaminase